jgi:two-component system sensor histidine kinase KdpD
VLIKLLETIGSVTEALAIGMRLPNGSSENQEQWLYCSNPPPLQADEVSAEAVKFAMVQSKAVGWDDSTHWAKALSHLHKQGAIYLPITFENQTLGVICVKLKPGAAVATNEKKVVDSLVNHAAVVLHRDELLQIQAQAKALTEVDRLKTALLSMVSHDFRSPLTSIKAAVGSLLQEDATIDLQTQRSLLQGVDQETDRLNRLVGNILDFSRLEAHAWAPRKEFTPVAELVGPVLDSFDDEANERIRIELDSPKDLWIDSIQMTQVLRNLIENSLKYSKDEITVRIRLEDGSLNIDVIDSGPGLPKGEEKDIFKPFYRAASFRESSLPGMGMGLAVCKGLVEAHHGTLTASNREEGGAIFHINLPMSDTA